MSHLSLVCEEMRRWSRRARSRVTRLSRTFASYHDHRVAMSASANAIAHRFTNYTGTKVDSKVLHLLNSVAT